MFGNFMKAVRYYKPGELLRIEDVKKAIGYLVIPATVHTDSITAYESSLKLLQMFGDKILPSHEKELMDLERIP